jgi:hypothetical protein
MARFSFRPPLLLIILFIKSYSLISCIFLFPPSANSFGQSGQNNGGLVCWKEALEILQKEVPVRTQVGQKIPACVVLNAVRYGLVRKGAFCRQALWLIDRSN